MLATGTGESHRRTVALGFLLLALVALIPIASVGLPPILDYPNHLARMHILAALPDTADLARYYRTAWAPIPDLAFDAIVPLLAHAVPVEIAMRLVLAATLLGVAGGCVALHRAAFARWSPWPLFSFLMLYNRMLLWGFLNYLVGLALMLWALAAWMALERRPAWQRIAVGLVFATAIYLAHLAAFGAYALALIGVSLAASSGKLRSTAIAAVTLLPAAILFMTAPTSSAGTHFEYGNPLRKFDLPVSIFDNYDRIFDGATFGIMLIATIVGLVRHRITLHARLRWSLAALLVAFIAMPSRLLSASGIDHRLPVAIALLFVASADWGAISPKWRKGATATILVLLLVRMAVVETVWLRADREYDALRPAFANIAPSATVAVAAPAEAVQAGGVPLLHFPTLAALDRNAFVDTIFADPRQQPLRLTDTAARLASGHVAGDLWQAAADNSLPPLPGYDDLVIVDPPPGLDTAKLPGPVLFSAPRMMLIQLSQPVPAQ
jgi:hypothetical protein